MTLPVPLSVRLVTPIADRHVEAELHDLSFRSVVPGGFASCRMSLTRPLGLTPEEIAYYGQVTVYDKRNGNQVWCGRLDDPGRTAGDTGPLYEITAVGGSAHAHDRTLPHIFVDSETEDWEESGVGVKYMDVSRLLGDDEDPAAIKFSVNEGARWIANNYGEVWYRRLVDTGQRLARCKFHHDWEFTDANNEIDMMISVGTGGGLVTANWDPANTASASMIAVITTDWSAGTDYDVVRAQCWRTTSTLTVTDGLHNMWFWPHVRTVLYDKEGSERTAAANYTVDTVKAEEVVEDLLGRVLTEYDGTNATVETSTYGIDHLAYREGVDAWKVFEDLLVFHRDNYWAAWERGSTGLYRFEWREWPVTVRYEADTVDGFNAPGSAADLYNYVTVRWVSAENKVRSVRRTQTVPVLDDAGLIREGYIDLLFDGGTSSNATQAGDEFLAQHAIPVSGATLTIARPIMDFDTGRMIMPWEIRPGHLIRVRGLVPSAEALTPAGRDGISVFQVVGVDFDTNTAAATLELDEEPVADLAYQLARNKPRNA